MNRRAFLNTLMALAGTAVLDPERLLWVPGAKKIFVMEPIAPCPYYDIEAVMKELAEQYERESAICEVVVLRVGLRTKPSVRGELTLLSRSWRAGGTKQ